MAPPATVAALLARRPAIRAVSPAHGTGATSPYPTESPAPSPLRRMTTAPNQPATALPAVLPAIAVTPCPNRSPSGHPPALPAPGRPLPVRHRRAIPLPEPDWRASG